MSVLRFSYKGIKVNLAHNLFYHFKIYAEIKGEYFSSLFGITEKNMTEYGEITTDAYRHIENELKQMIKNIMGNDYQLNIYIFPYSLPATGKPSLADYYLSFDWEFSNPSHVDLCIDAFQPFIRYLNFAPFHLQHEKIKKILMKKNILYYHIKIFHDDELVSPGFFIGNTKIGDHKTIDFSLMDKILFKISMDKNPPDINFNIPISCAIDMFHELIYNK